MPRLGQGLIYNWGVLSPPYDVSVAEHLLC